MRGFKLEVVGRSAVAGTTTPLAGVVVPLVTGFGYAIPHGASSASLVGDGWDRTSSV